MANLANSGHYIFSRIILFTLVIVNLIIVPSVLVTHSLYLNATNDIGRQTAILPNLPRNKDASAASNNRTSQNANKSVAELLPNETGASKNYRQRKDMNYYRSHSPKQRSSNTPYQLAQDRLRTMERLMRVLGLNDTTELLRFVHQSGTSPVPRRSDTLPAWSQIEDRYGPAFPHILGLDRCEEYRNAVVPNPQDRWVAPAGLFHSGTNLLSLLMAQTCSGGNSNLQPRGQVPYGKHNPIQAATVDGFRIPKEEYRQVQDLSRVLPIVMVRHPLDWMQSLCRQSYTVSWDRNSSSTSLPCPSLDTPVRVKLYKDFSHDNVLDFWSEWYAGYWNYTAGARLVVRLEDLVFAPMETLFQICSCVGGHFRYDSRILRDRQGGTVRRGGGGGRDKQRTDQGEEEHFLIQAWKRHAAVTLESSLPSSPENRRLFRELVGLPTMREILHGLNYNPFGSTG
jgi:hypothetical protein